MKLDDLIDLPPWDWPHDAAQRILAVLERPDDEDVLSAARLAGEYVVMSDDIAHALLDLIRSDAAEEVRAAATSSLGTALEDVDTMGADDPDVSISRSCFRRIQKSLRGLYFDGDVPELVRRRALESSVHAPAEWHANAIRAAHASGDPDWLQTALSCMGYVDGFDDELVAALAREEEYLRLEAVIAIGQRHVDAAWPDLARLVKSRATGKDLRLAAIEALAAIRPEASQSILSDLLDDDDDDIAEAAGEAFGLAAVFAEHLDDEL